MAGSRSVIILCVLFLLLACSRGEQPAEPAGKPQPTVILKPKPRTMSAEQRKELGFPEELIREVEAASEAIAEPFFEDVMMRTANLRGDVMIAGNRLMGFSVRTQKADEVIINLSPSYRRKGYLLFRSEQNYGRVPDIVTVVKGSSSYDILKIQKTEAPNYHLDTKAIIKWLKEQQSLGSFVVTGAGADWVEARFISPPKNMKAFARKIVAFAPDVMSEGGVDKLTRRMEKTKSFSLWWD
ncbi:MAG: DUF4253 domain-containing protein [Nitrospirota bacterium]|nr:DUF4253 domain-containing protein [Nitrospirota bacterium]